MIDAYENKEMSSSKNVIAAGFIIFRRFSNEIQYLLLQASNGAHHWTPPKGHVDPGETELQAALRETKEEAGLSEDQMNVYQQFKHEMNYMAWGRPKSVVYWLSEVKDPSVQVSLSHEHQAWKWYNINDALNIARYEEMEKALKEADDFIKGQL